VIKLIEIDIRKKLTGQISDWQSAIGASIEKAFGMG
jgi:hypothetical protein